TISNCPLTHRQRLHKHLRRSLLPSRAASSASHPDTSCPNDKQRRTKNDHRRLHRSRIRARRSQEAPRRPRLGTGNAPRTEAPRRCRASAEQTNIPPLLPILLPNLTTILKTTPHDPSPIVSLTIKLLSPVPFT
ncbi:hypothetical protein CTA2_4960, partial [Colletotrichum tanaceti]